jgi:CheY-specific phosphatase CheX
MDAAHLYRTSAEIFEQMCEALALGPCAVVASHGDELADDVAALISVVGDDVSYQLGIVGSRTMAEHLTRRLLQLPDDPPLDADEVSDALCEIANIYAGMLKGELATEEAGLRLGLPAFVHGRVEHPPSAHLVTVHARVDEVPVALVAVQGDGRAAEAAEAAE